MSSAQVIDVKWNEDGSATALGRLTARNGSGAATGVNGEGNFAQQVDITSIEYQVYERDADGVFQPVSGEGGSVSVASSVLDTVDTSNAIWTIDSIGYNFIHDLPASSFPTGGKIYLVEYKFTYSGGKVGWGRYRGPAVGVETS